MQGLGGVLYGQETTSGAEARSVLTIKVPPENFAEAMRRLAGIGRLVSQSVFTDDVTERVVDLESQIATAETSVERLRALLAAATDMEDIVSLERELMQRETDLELLRGQLRTLGDQVALATIVLSLTEPYPEPAVDLVGTAYFGHDGGAACPGSVELEVKEGELLTLCYEVRNTGDTPLGDIEVYDSGMDVQMDDLIVVEGDLEAPLPPGGHLILAFETEADPNRWSDPWVPGDRPRPQRQPAVADRGHQPGAGSAAGDGGRSCPASWMSSREPGTACSVSAESSWWSAPRCRPSCGSRSCWSWSGGSCGGAARPRMPRLPSRLPRRRRARRTRRSSGTAVRSAAGIDRPPSRVSAVRCFTGWDGRPASFFRRGRDGAGGEEGHEQAGGDRKGPHHGADDLAVPEVVGGTEADHVGRGGDEEQHRADAGDGQAHDPS